MINITVGSNTSRRKVMADESKTVADLLREENIDFSTSTIYVDGGTLKAGETNKTIGELGLTDDSTIIAVVKLDCAQ